MILVIKMCKSVIAGVTIKCTIRHNLKMHMEFSWALTRTR